MSRPHPRLVDLARGEPLGVIDDGVVASAFEHRMQGLLFSQVRDGRAGVAPMSNAWQDLAGDDLVRRQRTARIWEAAARIRSDLAGAGLDSVVLKGPPLEARWYDRTGERPTTDLDLWLDPRQVDRYGEALRRVQPDHPLGDTAQALVDTGDMQAIEALYRGVTVDLHTDAFKVRVPMRTGTAMFDRAVSVRGPDGPRVAALAVEDALVHHVLHLTKDRFRFLLGYVDVARMVRDPVLDWSRVWEVARAEGLETPVVLALRAVDEVVPLGIALPPAPRGWRASLWRRAWPPSVRLSGTIGIDSYRFRQDLLPLLARGRAAETFRTQWRQRLFPPPAMIDHVYPGLQGPYPWRLVAGRIRAARHRHRDRA